MNYGNTPLLDELEKGAWPSFVKELKKAAKKSPIAAALIDQLEASYREKIGHWKPGGIVGVKGYGGGVVGRYSDDPERFPAAKEFHTLRVNQPAGFFYTTKKLRELADVWDKHGSGLYNMHGSTGDIILLGCDTANLQPCFDALSEIGFDLGGSGGAMRTPSCCVGAARCEKACIDSMNVAYNLTMHYQEEMHRPSWPYKFKIKVSACPNDCAAASARSDLAIIGTWRDTLKIDQAGVREYAAKSLDISEQVVRKCPTQALVWDADKKELKINVGDCVRCMNCINVMPKALHIGSERGATLLIGGKAPVVKGAMIGWVLVPFIKMEPPYTELKELIDKLIDWWADNAKTRERIGELIDRMGLPVFLEAVGLKPLPQMVRAPRANPYIFWNDKEVVKHG
jgi:sulfite reductase alpha subunit